MHVCFVDQQIYPLLQRHSTVQLIGGAELQQVYLGKGLRSLGYQITYVTCDYGQPDYEEIDGIGIIKTYRPYAGIPGVRFFYPRSPKMWSALKHASADIYYVRGENYFVGLVARFCKQNRAKLIFAGAHERNFIPDEVKIPHLRNRLFYRYGLRSADLIICQSFRQRELLNKYHHRDGVVVPNVIPETLAISPLGKRKNYVIWVSTIRSWKRPWIFLELARLLPNRLFVMIGGPGEGEQNLYHVVKNECKLLPNMQFLGFLPLEETEKWIGAARILVNTSEREGFPNTFLQAWRSGVPTVSFFDPDNCIARNDLGATVNSVKEMAMAIVALEKDLGTYSYRVKDYFCANHRLEGVICRYDQIINELSCLSK